MHKKSTTVIAILSLLGLVAGAAFGILAPDSARSLGLFGNLFIGILVVLAIPMIIANVAVAASLLGDAKKIARTCRNSVWYYLILSSAAVVIGLLTVLVLRPGAHDTVGAGIRSFQPDQFGDLFGFFASYFSPNIAQQIGQGQFLTLVLFALLFGAFLVATSGKLSTSGRFFKDASGAMGGVTRAIAPYVPLGLFALTAAQFSRYYSDFQSTASSLGYYVATIAIATILVGAVILPLALKIFGKASFAGYFTRLLPAMANAMGTSSSSATLPFTWDATIEGNKVDERAASVSLPLGVVLNVGATAMFSVISFLFLTQAAGLSVSIGQLLMLCIMAMVLSIGTTGLPRVGVSIVLVLLGTFSFDAVLTSPALPMIVLVDLLIIDRIRALLNVWGDAVGASVIAQTFEMKTAPRKISHSSPRTGRTDHRERSPRQDRSRRSGSDRPDRPDRRQRDGRRSSGPDRGRGRDRDRDRDRQDRPERSGHSRSRVNDSRSETRDNSPFAINATRSSGIDMDTAAKVEKPERPSRSSQDRPERQSDSPDRSRQRSDSRSSVRRNGRSSSERPTSDRSRSSSPAPKPIPAETIKREKAKVAAQLAAMKQDDPVEELNDIELVEDEQVKIERPVEDSEPEETSVTETNFRPEPKPESAESEPPKAEEDEKPEPTVTYGRSRKSKTPKFDESAEETTEEPPGDSKEPEFSTDEISFGRGKRKKVR